MNLFLSLLFFYWTYGYKITSPDHIFFNDKQEYVINQIIIPGSRLLNKDGETIEVCNVSKKDTVTEVYDLITRDGEYSAGESGVMSGTCILRFLSENKPVYPNLYNNYKALDKTRRARLVEDLYEAKKAGNDIAFAGILINPSGILTWQKLENFLHLRRSSTYLEGVRQFVTSANVNPQVSIDEVVEAIEKLQSQANQIEYVDHLIGFINGTIQWGHIDYDQPWPGYPNSTLFNVRVKYQNTREQVGADIPYGDILEFHLNIPTIIQQQKAWHIHY